MDLSASNHLIVRCHRASTTVPQAQHSTAQHSSAINPAQSSKPSTCRSECDNASEHRELARPSMSLSIYTARCVLKTNEEIEICLAQKNILPLTKQLSWCGAPNIFCLFDFQPQYVTSNSTVVLCLRHFCKISYTHAASGLFSWNMEFLAFASGQLRL